MARLSDIQLPTEAVEVSVLAEPLEIRGLSFADFTTLYAHHGDSLAAFFTAVMGAQTDGMMDSIQSVFVQFFQDSPRMFAEAIALANDDYSEKSINTAARLPMLDQGNVVSAVFRQTFRSEDDVKKLVVMAGEALGSLTTTMESLSAIDSSGGFGGAESA